MESISKNFNEEDDGFSGNVEGYIVKTNEENLKNWLESENINFYDNIKDNVEEIFVLKNINVDKEYQSQGFGTQIIMDILNNYYVNAIVLICDNQEIQQDNFVLEKFYNNIGFVNINNELSPLMIYPEELGNKIKKELGNKNKFKM